MSKQTLHSEATTSLILYTAKQYGGLNSLNVKHGDAGDIALSADNWLYQSAALSGMQAYLWSEVNPENDSLSYLNHIESVITTSKTPDLTALYPQAQYPLQYLGVDPSQATLVRLEIVASQPMPNAVASTAFVGGSETSVTTLSLPGLPGLLGFVSTISGSSTTASCPYGDYDTRDGTVAWSGTGTVVLEYVNGGVTIVSTTGFPQGWAFEAPVKQADGTWKVTLNGQASSPGISSLTADPTSIVADGEMASTLTAVVTDSGAALSGIVVSWTASAGGNLSVLQSVTDGNGKATTSLTSTYIGSITVTATLDNGNYNYVNIDVEDNTSFEAYYVTRTPVQYDGIVEQPNNAVVFYGKPKQSISVSITGNAFFVWNGEKKYNVSLDDQGYAEIPIADATIETITVTSVCGEYSTVGSLQFVSLGTQAGPAAGCTTNAPADQTTPNEGFTSWNDSNMVITAKVNGSAYFDNGEQSIQLVPSYPVNEWQTYNFSVRDSVPETVTVSIYYNGASNPGQSFNTTFVPLRS